MSSRRFPGKVLAPFRGKPLIDHVVGAVRDSLPHAPCVVLTSEHPTDTPLATYPASAGVEVFRGSLDDVFARFRAALEHFPCDQVYRICADSPLLDRDVLSRVAALAAEEWDLVTTIFPRTFPKGHNVELIRVRAFLSVQAADLSPEEREHPTRVFYDHSERYRIFNVESGDRSLAERNFCVDTVDDLWRLARCLSHAQCRARRQRITTDRGRQDHSS
jgi:spore coat polysaccharide biosynthesis protein SpsF